MNVFYSDQSFITGFDKTINTAVIIRSRIAKTEPIIRCRM